MNDALGKVLAARDVREKSITRGAEPIPSTPDAFIVFLREDMRRWAKTARAANLKIEYLGRQTCAVRAPVRDAGAVLVRAVTSRTSRRSSKSWTKA